MMVDISFAGHWPGLSWATCDELFLLLLFNASVHLAARPLANGFVSKKAHAGQSDIASHATCMLSLPPSIGPPGQPGQRRKQSHLPFPFIFGRAPSRRGAWGPSCWFRVCANWNARIPRGGNGVDTCMPFGVPVPQNMAARRTMARGPPALSAARHAAPCGTGGLAENGRARQRQGPRFKLASQWRSLPAPRARGQTRPGGAARGVPKIARPGPR